MKYLTNRIKLEHWNAIQIQLRQKMWITFATLIYLRLEKVFGSSDADLVDVDLALLREDAESGILLQFSGRKLSKDQQKFAKRNVTVFVFVNFLQVLRKIYIFSLIQNTF